jgi:hypothetical protein
VRQADDRVQVMKELDDQPARDEVSENRDIIIIVVPGPPMLGN